MHTDTHEKNTVPIPGSLQLKVLILHLALQRQILN